MVGLLPPGNLTGWKWLIGSERLFYSGACEWKIQHGEGRLGDIRAHTYELDLEKGPSVTGITRCDYTVENQGSPDVTVSSERR